jgi:hypothetical protein
MALAELRRALLDSFGSVLSPLGFRLHEQSFWRPQDGVGHVVHISFINHATDFDFTIDVAVRHNEVEERLSAQRHLSARQKTRTATVGVELGNYADGRFKRWTVAHPEDVVTVTQEALSWLNRFGDPFLQRFSSLEEVVSVLESGSREGLLICPIPTTRDAVVAVAKAILTEREQPG